MAQMWWRSRLILPWRGRNDHMLLNYTTAIPLARTLAEIAAAVPVPVTFEREHSRVVAVAFRYGGELYQLSPNVEGAWALLKPAEGVNNPRVNGFMSRLSAWCGAACCPGSRQSSRWWRWTWPPPEPGRGLDADSPRSTAWCPCRNALNSIGESGWNSHDHGKDLGHVHLTQKEDKTNEQTPLHPSAILTKCSGGRPRDRPRLRRTCERRPVSFITLIPIEMLCRATTIYPLVVH